MGHTARDLICPCGSLCLAAEGGDPLGQLSSWRHPAAASALQPFPPSFLLQERPEFLCPFLAPVPYSFNETHTITFHKRVVTTLGQAGSRGYCREQDRSLNRYLQVRKEDAHRRHELSLGEMGYQRWLPTEEVTLRVGRSLFPGSGPEVYPLALP